MYVCLTSCFQLLLRLFFSALSHDPTALCAASARVWLRARWKTVCQSLLRTTISTSAHIKDGIWKCLSDSTTFTSFGLGSRAKWSLCAFVFPRSPPRMRYCAPLHVSNNQKKNTISYIFICIHKESVTHYFPISGFTEVARKWAPK